ncbi:CgeB family protein [Amorphus coralli]|uniref:CgeB family protein n=1 Tax=Amorphus coralli TaxID=340680 RepID=UPI00036BC674|nr:glycosyltransferase [Amorphus coralli]
MTAPSTILVIGKFYTEGFALHIAETLAAMGHGVRRFEPGMSRLPGRVGQRVDQVRSVLHGASDNVPLVRARRMRALWKELERGPVNIVIVCHDFLWPEDVSELKRRSGAAVTLWFPDAIVNFRKAFFLNAPYDALFFKDPYAVSMLRGVLGNRVFYLPEAFNPDRHRLPDGDGIGNEFRCDIATAGNLHSWRVALFRQLDAYDVRIWGAAPPLWLPLGPVKAMARGRAVFNADKARAFLGAKIVVNNLHYGEIWGANVRIFEAAGIGAFQLVDWRPSLSSLFVDGSELVTFRGVEDLKRLIDHYLPREAERLEIAEAGKRRAHAEHTYRHRLALLLATLDGSQCGFPLPAAGWSAAP